MRRMLSAVSLCALVGATTLAAAVEPAPVSQRWAVLIGVDDYAYAQKLAYCGEDQRALRDELVASGFPDDQVFLLHDKAADPRFRPSKGNIERQFDLVLKLADTDDLVVVAFSGHGVQVGGKSFLCPGDCTLDDSSTLISLDDFYDRLKECAAQFKLVLVDACRNDPRPGGARSMTASEGTRALARSLQEIKLPEGVVLLNSCAPGEVSWEDEKFGHGVFMHYVLDGLRGAADRSGDGKVSLNELQSYAGARTKTYVANRYSVPQRPFFRGDLSTEALEFALLPVTKRDAAPPTPPAPPPPPLEITNSIGLKLRRIPEGEFVMGSRAADPEIRANESPQHRVRISRPFYMGTYEVTRGQFAQFAASALYRTEPERDGGGSGYVASTGEYLGTRPEFTWRNAGFPQTDDHPVMNVTWNDAAAFCAWLSRQENRIYRLPTEAEWEYACRAGANTIYPTGDDVRGLTTVANVPDASLRFLVPQWNAVADRDGYAYTAPVGSFRPNAFGLYDMSGNVWEWCQDRFADDYYRSSPPVDPGGAGAGDRRSVRGGSWNVGAPSDNRFAVRYGDPPTHRHPGNGFRVVLEP